MAQAWLPVSSTRSSASDGHARAASASSSACAARAPKLELGAPPPAAAGADAPAPAPAGAATVKVVPPEPTNDLAVIFRRFVCPEGRFRSLCGARNWANVNIHRKIDIIVVGIAGGFFAIGCALILAWY
jgi:hypothetical protein